MSASMRNAIQRRQHRERGQLHGREKWGILEKHKDYSLRAKDYNVKKAKLKRLQEKAQERNPDEFAFGMMSEHSRVQGRHGAATRDSATARGLSHEAIKLLKTQDAGYLRTVGERIRRQIERLEQEIRLQDGIQGVLGDAEDDDEENDGHDHDADDDDNDFDFDFGDIADSKGRNNRASQQKKNRKLVFADDRLEQRQMKKRLRDDLNAKKLQDDEGEEGSDEGDEATFSRRQQQQQQSRAGASTSKASKKQLLAERQAVIEARRARKLRKRAAEARQNKLKALKKQYQEIVAAETELQHQRARMDNSVGGTNKDGIKWKIRERKR